MEIDIIKIGNSQGIRLPIAILRQCGIKDKVELKIENNTIIIIPKDSPRTGWATAFKQMNEDKADMPVSEEIDQELLEDWDE